MGLPGAAPGLVVMPYSPLASPALQAGPSSVALRLRNLPGDASVADVAHYFSGKSIVGLIVTAKRHEYSLLKLFSCFTQLI